MVDSAGGPNHRKFVGNACLYRDLVTQRRFLKRNLRHILDSHGYTLNGKISNAAPHEDMIANERRAAGWDFPTKEMLDDLLKGEKPVLQLQGLQIRHPRSKVNLPTIAKDNTDQDNDLDWLPNPDAGFRRPCHVGITILESRPSKKSIHVDRRSATIIQRERDSCYPLYDVELDRPMSIELDKLFVVTDSGTNGFRSWKKTVTASYVMEVSVQCQDSDDTADFLSRLEDRSIKYYKNTPGNEGVLRATWNDLPECPRANALLTLKRPQGHRSLELQYKAQVSMGWTRRRDSPLERYNQKWRQINGARPQLPTPSASEDQAKEASHHVTTWKYQDGPVTKVCEVQGLFCALCRDSQGRDAAEYASLDRMQLHWWSEHEQYRFEVEQAVLQPGSSTAYITVSMSLAEKEYDKKTGQGPDERENWVAPDRPFDLAKYIRGESDWTGQKIHAKKKTVAGRQAREKDRETMPPVVPQPSRRRPAPDEVEELPEHRPKKHCVPYVPGVSFYRTTSKEQLHVGEEVADSDNDVDETWLSQVQDRGLEDLGIVGGAKDFSKAFDKYLAREQSDSSILFKDAIVRFAKKYSKELQGVEWQRHFRAKLNQLRKTGVIDDDAVQHCVRGLRTRTDPKDATAGADVNGDGDAKQDVCRLANGASAPANDQASGRVRKAWSGGKFVPRQSALPQRGGLPNSSAFAGRDSPLQQHDTTVNGYPTPTEPKASDDVSCKSAKVCLCGKSAKDMRGSIACADPVSQICMCSAQEDLKLT